MRRSPRPTSRRRALRPARLAPPALLAVAGGLAILAAGTGDAAQEGLGVDGVRAALEKMVETRRVISRERTDWALGRELLTERASVLREEIQNLRTRIEETNASIAEADQKREELLDESTRLREASAELAEVVGGLERRTAELLVRMPTPVQDRVRPLSQRFPEDPADTDVSLSIRFQNVIGVLNEIIKFNREVTVTSETRTVETGLTPQQVRVAAVYVGVAYGYYASSDGRYAGVGTSRDGEAWSWTAQDQAAANIRQAIAILQGEGIAEFIPLPVTID